MGNAKRIGLGTNVGHVATRMTVSVAVATVVAAATVMPAPESTVSPDVRLAASTVCDGTAGSTCALIMGGTTIPKWNDADVAAIVNQFITPTRPAGQTIEPIAVTTPSELWPLTGLFRLLGRLLGPPSIFAPGGAGWPDEPLWKFSGLFDLTFDQSVQTGLADLETAMTEHGNDNLVIYGYSQGAIVANLEKRKLAEQYPAGTSPNIDFVLSEDPNLPNGGLAARFPGLYIPILDFTFSGPAPTDTQFDTVTITRQYDGVADFPLYPLNLLADLNALLGVFYVHLYPLDVSLAADPSKYDLVTHGSNRYYFFPTEDLPLFGPLRTLGVPEPVIDVFEPFFREIVELGYDRSIQPWEPTPARLIPAYDRGTVAKDLVGAIGEGISNAAALIGVPAPLGIPAAQTADNTDRDAAVEQHLPEPGTTLKTIIGEVNHPVAQGSSAVRSPLSVVPATTGDQINGTIAAVNSVIGDGRTIIRSTSNGNSSPAATGTATNRARVRDAVKNAQNDIKKAVPNVSDSIKKALSGGKRGDDGGGGMAESAP